MKVTAKSNGMTIQIELTAEEVEDIEQASITPMGGSLWLDTERRFGNVARLVVDELNNRKI